MSVGQYQKKDPQTSLLCPLHVFTAVILAHLALRLINSQWTGRLHDVPEGATVPAVPRTSGECT